MPIERVREQNPPVKEYKVNRLEGDTRPGSVAKVVVHPDSAHNDTYHGIQIKISKSFSTKPLHDNLKDNKPLNIHRVVAARMRSTYARELGYVLIEAANQAEREFGPPPEGLGT